jgi:2-dehydropantoate 2-reductase
MRIAIVSPGGVGGYLGALLARSGEDVVALARGKHLAAIKETGIRIDGPRGNFTVSLPASDDASEFGIADVVVFAVKLFQVEAAVDAARSLFGPDTVGLSLLNGVAGATMISEALPDTTILGGSAYVSAVISAPGHIRYTGAMSSLVIGEPPEGSVAWHTIVDFSARCKRAGIGVETSKDVRSVLWEKLIGLSTHSALTTASRRPSGNLYNDPDVIEVADALITEAIAVARAHDVQLSDGLKDAWLERLKSFPFGLYASMYYDLEKGNPLEINSFSGYIVSEGKRLGVATPHHSALFAVLKPYIHGKPDNVDRP